MKELFDGEYAIPEGYTASVENCKIIVKKEESDDEKIRKWIINEIKIKHHNLDEANVDFVDKAIAWLEKKCEKIKLIENFDTEFEKQVSYLIASVTNREYEYTEDFIKWAANGLLEYAKHEIEKQGEQKQPTKYTLEQAAHIFLDALSNTPYNNKPVTDAQVITMELLKFLSDAYSYNPNAINKQNTAWSEEDERMYKAISIALSLKDAKGYLRSWYKTPEDADDWLKSLKYRRIWKPSDEQIEAIRLARSFVTDDFSDNPTLSEILIELENQLKKLMDE